ncbi:efflux RND transporter permease subunit, partial [Marinobacter salarius]
SPEIAQVTISGFSEQEIEVSVPSETLKQFGLSISDLSNRIQQESISIPAGTMKNDLSESSIRFDQLAKQVDDIGNLMINSATQL